MQKSNKCLATVRPLINLVDHTIIIQLKHDLISAIFSELTES